MRHGIAGNTLGRKSAHRKATVRDIAKATLLRQQITTTKIKAKEARKLVDRLITLGKKGTLADKRRAFSILCDHKLVSRLFNTMAPKFRDRKGGYTRIIQVGNRRGDNAEMALLELTEKEEIIVAKPRTAAPKKAAVKTVEEPVQDKKPGVEDQDAKDKLKKGFAGGLRRMFRRKAT